MQCESSLRLVQGGWIPLRLFCVTDRSTGKLHLSGSPPLLLCFSWHWDCKWAVLEMWWLNVKHRALVQPSLHSYRSHIVYAMFLCLYSCCSLGQVIYNAFKALLSFHAEPMYVLIFKSLVTSSVVSYRLHPTGQTPYKTSIKDGKGPEVCLGQGGYRG